MCSALIFALRPQKCPFSEKDHSLEEETDGPTGPTRWYETWTTAGGSGTFIPVFLALSPELDPETVS